MIEHIDTCDDEIFGGTTTGELVETFGPMPLAHVELLLSGRDQLRRAGYPLPPLPPERFREWGIDIPESERADPSDCPHQSTTEAT